MHRFRLLFLAVSALPALTYAQNVGINVDGTAPHPSALLDIDGSAITGSKRGLLIPRVTATEMNAIVAPATSLLVFNTTANAFFFFNGTAWTPLSTVAGWGLTGNTGTNPATNFLGTTDAQPLRFRVNNTFAGQMPNLGTGLLSLGLNTGLASTGTNNTFIGSNAGAATTTGSHNTFVGNGAGAANTTLGSNVYVGHEAGNANATGQENVYVGRRAGALGTSGSTNVLIGGGAGIQNTANNNVMIGGFAGGSNTIGGGNTFVGTQAGSGTNTGGQNTFIGTNAGNGNTTGQQLTVIGNGAGVGSNNLINATAIGRASRVDADHSLVLGSVSGVNGATTTVNVGIGTTTPAERLDVVGSIRMVDGNQAANRVMVSDANGTAAWQTLNPTTTNAWGINGNAGTNATTNFIGTTDAQVFRFRTNNVFAGQIPVFSTGLLSLGVNAGVTSTGSNNTIFGNSAGDALTTGNGNTIMGSATGSSLINGHGNTFIGHAAANNTTSGSNNVMLGAFAGMNNNGDNNTLVGLNAGITNTSGTQNAFFGAGAGAANFTGGFNTLIGTVAGVDLTTGSENAFVGWDAGGGATQGSELAALGANTDFVGTTTSNSTAIGANARVTASNSLVLGGITGINGGTDVNVGIGTTAPARSLHISRGASGGTSSADAKLLLEDNADNFQQFLHPSGFQSGLLFGTELGSIRAGIVFNEGLISDGLDFRTGGNTVRAVLTNTGDLGLGTTTPDQHAEIEGTGVQYLRISSTSGASGVSGIELRRSGIGASDWQMRNEGGLLLFGQSADELVTTTDVLRLGGGSVTPATDNSITCGQAGLRWTSVFAVNGTINTSDAREKTGVRDLDHGLNAVMRLRPVRFQWKDRPEEGEKLGLIAQEVQQVLPETVVDSEWHVNENGARERVPTERLGVYYSDLIPVLVNAIQEQEQRIQELERELQDLRERK